jgi:thiamine biosynthesis protein ThiS
VSTGGASEVELTVNGRPRRCPPGTSLADLLETLECDPRTVAVELNGAIVGRAGYAGTGLESGDRLEIVRFVQGG